MSLKLNLKSQNWVSCRAEDNVNQQQEMPISLAKDVSKATKLRDFPLPMCFIPDHTKGASPGVVLLKNSAEAA